MANGYGGRRVRAGRPPGRPNKRTQELIEQVEKSRSKTTKHQRQTVDLLGQLYDMAFDESLIPRDRIRAGLGALSYLAARPQSIELVGEVDVAKVKKPKNVREARALLRKVTGRDFE